MRPAERPLPPGGVVNLKVHDEQRKVFTLSGISVKMTMGAVKRNLEKFAVTPKEGMRLMFKGTELADGATCESIGYREATGDYITLLTSPPVVQPPHHPQNQTHIELRIVNTETGREFSFKVKCPDPAALKVPSLKKALEGQTGVPASDIILTHKGVEMTTTCAGVDSAIFMSTRHGKGNPSLPPPPPSHPQPTSTTRPQVPVKQRFSNRALRVVDDKAAVYTLEQKGVDMMRVPVKHIKATLVKSAGIPIEEIVLLFKGKELTEGATCSAIGFIPEVDMLRLVLKDDWVVQNRKSMKPQETPIKTTNLPETTQQHGGGDGVEKEVVVVDVARVKQYKVATKFTNLVDLKITSLQKSLSKLTDIPPDDQVLLYLSRELTDNCGGVTGKIYLCKRGDPPPDVSYVESKLDGGTNQRPDAGSQPHKGGISVEYVTTGGVKELKLDSAVDMLHVKGKHLKAALRQNTGLDVSEMVLRWEGKIINDGQTCREIGMVGGEKIQLVAKIDPEELSGEDEERGDTNDDNDTAATPVGHRKVRVVNLMVKPSKEYAVHSVGADVSKMTASGIRKALEHICSFEPDVKLYLDTTILTDEATCRDIAPNLPEYTLYLCKEPPRSVTSTFVVDPMQPAIQLDHDPSASVGHVRSLLAKKPGFGDMNFYLSFKGNPCSDLEPAGGRRVFNIVKTARSRIGRRRFTMPDFRVEQKFHRMETNTPRDPWLAFGFRVGAWEGLDRSSATPASRWGRALKHCQKDRVFLGRKRSATQVPMPTGLSPSQWFKHLGYRLPVVLTLNDRTKAVLDRMSVAPIRFKAGEDVPQMSPTRVKGIEQLEDPTTPGSPGETHRTQSAHVPPKRYSENMTSSSRAAHATTTNQLPQESKAVDWRTLATTMRSTHEIASKLSNPNPVSPRKRGYPPPLLHTNRGPHLSTPQASRAATLHQSLASATGSEWGTPYDPAMQNTQTAPGSPVFTHSASLVERLTMVENILTSRATGSKRTVPK